MSLTSAVEEYVAYTSGVIKGDLMSVFIPYVVYLVDQNKYESLDNEDAIAKDFFEQYSFNLDPVVLHALLVLIVQQEYVYKDFQNIYVSNTQKIRSHKFGELYKDAISAYSSLKEKCREYITLEIGMPCPSDYELDNAVYELIQSVGKNTVPFAHESTTQPSISTYSEAVNDFVLYAEKEFPSIVDDLNKLAVSDILWRVVSSGNRQNLFFRNGAQIFLDTRFVLRLMGLEGEYWQKLSSMLVNQIAQNGANLVLFEHVRVEIERIIKNAQTMFKAENFDITKASRVAKEFYRNSDKYSDIIIADLLYSLCYDSLQTYGFSIESHEYEAETDQFQLDYEKLKKLVVEEYRKSNPLFSIEDNEDSIEIDIRSITMCFRARGSFSTDRVDDIKALFLTTNTAILRAAQKIEHDSFSQRKVPIGMTAEYLSSFLALEKKIDYLQTNRILMLAYCYGAVQPTKAEIQDFVAALDAQRKTNKISEDRIRYLKQNQVFTRLYIINKQLPVEKRKTLEELEHAKVTEYRKKNETLESDNQEKDKEITALKEEVDRLTKEKNDSVSAYNSERASALSSADAVLSACRSTITTLLGLITTVIPFILDRLFPTIKYSWFISFWNKYQNSINLWLFIIGSFIFSISLVLRIKTVYQYTKTIIANVIYYIGQVKKNHISAE